MHPAEASHGDFGMLGKEDVLIAISNSGETTELISLLPAVKRLKIPIVAITNKPESSLTRFASHDKRCIDRNVIKRLGLDRNFGTK